MSEREREKIKFLWYVFATFFCHLHKIFPFLSYYSYFYFRTRRTYIYSYEYVYITFKVNTLHLWEFYVTTVASVCHKAVNCRSVPLPVNGIIYKFFVLLLLLLYGWKWAAIEEKEKDEEEEFENWEWVREREKTNFLSSLPDVPHSYIHSFLTNIHSSIWTFQNSNKLSKWKREWEKERESEREKKNFFCVSANESH